jgi:hypothetical protein
VSKPYLRITADGECVFSASLGVGPGEAVYHAQQQVDLHAWAKPGAKVVGELTGAQGEQHLLHPAGEVA